MQETRINKFMFSSKEIVDALKAQYPGNLRLQTLSDDYKMDPSTGITITDAKAVPGQLLIEKGIRLADGSLMEPAAPFPHRVIP